MLRKFARACVAVLALVSFSGLGTAHAGDLDDTEFLIKKGNHYDSNGLGLRAPRLNVRVDRTLSFQVLFPESAVYTTKLPSNQGDNNKLMGISGVNIHGNSIRLGWAWNPTQRLMELRFYGYIQKQRISIPITRIPLNTWASVALRFHNNGLSVTVNGLKVEQNRSLGLSSWIPTSTAILKTAYFGGDETAPHDIRVKVRNIRF